MCYCIILITVDMKREEEYKYKLVKFHLLNEHNLLDLFTNGQLIFLVLPNASV